MHTHFIRKKRKFIRFDTYLLQLHTNCCWLWQHEPLQLGWWHVDEGRCAAGCIPFWTITRANTDHPQFLNRVISGSKQLAQEGLLPCYWDFQIFIAFFSAAIMSLVYAYPPFNHLSRLFLFFKCFKKQIFYFIFFLIFLYYFNIFTNKIYYKKITVVSTIKSGGWLVMQL